MTWDHAVEFCREEGGYLVEIHDCKTQQAVEAMLTGKCLAWMGLESMGSELRWLSGSSVSYQNFGDTAHKLLSRRKVFAKQWLSEYDACVQNPFIIEWV